MSETSSVVAAAESEAGTRARFGLLLAALVLLIILLPFVPGGEGGWLYGTMWTAVIVAGVVSASQTRSQLVIALVVGAPVILARWLEFSSNGQTSVDDMLQAASSALFLLIVAWILVAFVFAQQELTLNELLGGVNAYLLIGLAFSEVHRLVELLHPGSYLMNGVALTETTAAQAGMGHLLFYFSFTTLTTLGYGDITPALPFARIVAALEAVTGQLFVAILIARMVAVYADRRR